MRTLYARPTQDWPVLGLQGQTLGTIVSCALDAGTGKVKYVELKTSWQTMYIQWPNVEFDEKRQSFKLNKHGTIDSLASQASPGSADCDS